MRGGPAERHRGALVVAAAGLALTLPGLGRFGLWEPGELAIADHAAAFVRGAGPLVDAPRSVWPALGMRLLGASELSARLPIALLAVATLLAVLWAGSGLLRPRTGLIAAAVLIACPAFVLEARQLTSDVPAMLALVLAVGGLHRAVTTHGRARVFALLLATIGLGGGAFAAGLLVGVAVPLSAFAGAVLLERGGGRRAGIAAALTGGAIAAAALLVPHIEGQLSWSLGGVVKVAPVTQSYVGILRGLGFGLFPFGALGLFALIEPFAVSDDSDRPAFAGRLLLLTAALALAATTVQLRLTGVGHLVMVPIVALAIAGFLDRQLEQTGPNPLLGLLLATGAMLVARDLSLAPEDLVSVHQSAAITWPPTLTISRTLRLVGGISAIGLLYGQLPVGQRHRPLALAALLGPPMLFAIYLAHALVPALSHHLSLKALFDHQRALAGGDDRPLLLYRVARQGSGVFDQIGSTDVPSAAALASDLGAHPHDFALVARDELAALDDAFASAKIPYAVADASSSRTLLLTGRLPAGAPDVNPLRQNVWRGGGSPPWPPPRVTVASTFGRAVELIGAEFPESVRRPSGFTLTLFFRVIARPPPNYKIFVHVERPGEALIPGDHAPLEGAYPTAHWRPGDVIRDSHEISIPLVTSPAGTYDIAVGLWPGGDTTERLPVTAGPQDGHDRVRLGTLRVH